LLLVAHTRSQADPDDPLACQQPYEDETFFTQLFVDRIDRVLELNQIAFNSTGRSSFFLILGRCLTDLLSFLQCSCTARRTATPRRTPSSRTLKSSHEAW
jgi:hypothetical protein